MSDALIVRRGGSGGLPANAAVIRVSAPAGSTITFSKGGVIVKTLGPEKSHVNAGDADKADWFYPVSAANYGEWTVTASKANIGTGSYDVTVSSAKTYDVDISFGYLIYRNGWQHGYELSTITNVYDPNGTYAIDNNADPPRATTTRGNWGCALNNEIDVTNYNTLYVEIEIVYPDNYSSAFGLWVPSSDNARKCTAASSTTSGAAVSYDHNYGMARDTYTLDVSNLSGNYVFKVQVRDGATATRNYGIFLYDMYLSEDTP